MNMAIVASGVVDHRVVGGDSVAVARSDAARQQGKQPRHKDGPPTCCRLAAGGCAWLGLGLGLGLG